MFFKRIIQGNSRPPAKKVSHLIDYSSHKQKKYISLMVVPSYTTGKTRTLRVPRVLFHGVIISLLVISAIVMGFYLRSNYFQQMVYDLDGSLAETEARYHEFRVHAEQVQNDLRDAAAQIYEELNETEQRARSALDQQAQQHQLELESILNQIEEFEQKIREFDEDRQAIIDGLHSRGAVIPPVANLLAQLEESQNALREASRVRNTQEYILDEGVSFLAMGGPASSIVPVTHHTVLNQLQILTEELDLQRQLMECLESYRARMDGYLRNFPTLWPIRGTISSGFGWRRNPFSSRGSEHHDGVDIPARSGTHIRAAGGGKIIFSGWRNGFGNVVIIDHGSGINTLYAHNSRNLVTVGQVVERGDVIAHVGSTGRSTGAHLHYEVKINGTAVNPVPFMQEFHS
jgi:murein DD-endopeptidase MepM/ murein hydrolase activator NlpD